MKTNASIRAAICSLAILFGCAKRPSEEAARLAAAAHQDMVAGNFREAYTNLQQAADLRPDAAEYRIEAGKAAVKLGNKEEAAKQYRAAEQILARESHEDPLTVENHATVLVLLGRTAEATQVLKQGAERLPRFANLQNLASHPDSFIAGLRADAVGEVEPAAGGKAK